MTEKLLCHYCGREAERVTGKEVYPAFQYLWDKWFYRCLPCGAYVGCHPYSWRPLGTLANAELRAARIMAHSSFDPLWRNGEFKSRREAYKWLGEKMGLDRDDCHIGNFNLEQCLEVERLCNART